MHERFIQRYNIFIGRTGGTPEGIKEYLGICDNKININAYRCNIYRNSIIIIINYFNKINYIKFNVPNEINDIINSFCGNYIKLKLKLECMDGFPFIPPIWKLINIKHNLLNNIINIKDYYLWMVENMNYDNLERRGWTPIYGFDKELLRFFIRINHFDSIEYSY